MNIEETMLRFEKWASVQFQGTMNFSKSGDADFYISPIARACFLSWVASRNDIEIKLPGAYGAFGCMGEGIVESETVIDYEDTVNLIKSLGLRVLE